jgi:hypothetical protein
MTTLSAGSSGLTKVAKDPSPFLVGVVDAEGESRSI